MQLDRARPTDAEALTRVAHAAKRHWGYSDAWIADWRQALTVTPAILERQTIFCAREGTEVVGFYGLSGAGPVLELEHLWVLPDRIGRGIGRRLFEHAVETARAAGGMSSRIVSDPHAEGFYLRMGGAAGGVGAVHPARPEASRSPARAPLRGWRALVPELGGCRVTGGLAEHGS